MPNAQLSQVVLPITVDGQVQNITYDLKDATARQMIEDLGHALYWMGITTTELTDGATTNPITIAGESKEATLGGIASYNELEFVWNGTKWQAFGHSNFGALAFKSSATGNFTPAGSVNVTQGNDTTTSVTPFGSAGTLPTMTVSGEVLTFTPGTLPAAGTPVDVVTEAGEVTATFTGTQGSVTVE